jgi:SAM-dependent methyltransferase
VPVALAAEFGALPFPADSIDLVVLPHSLEFAHDPHQMLREVERVLRPEGRVVVTGFNPASLWGLRQRMARLPLGRGRAYLPRQGDFIGYWRLRDWLRLLGFTIESGQFGCWRPPMHTARWLQRCQWMDPIGERWWPVLGAALPGGGCQAREGHAPGGAGTAPASCAGGCRGGHAAQPGAGGAA